MIRPLKARREALDDHAAEQLAVEGPSVAGPRAVLGPHDQPQRLLAQGRLAPADADRVVERHPEQHEPEPDEGGEGRAGRVDVLAVGPRRAERDGDRTASPSRPRSARARRRSARRRGAPTSSRRPARPARARRAARGSGPYGALRERAAGGGRRAPSCGRCGPARSGRAGRACPTRSSAGRPRRRRRAASRRARWPSSSRRSAVPSPAFVPSADAHHGEAADAAPGRAACRRQQGEQERHREPEAADDHQRRDHVALVRALVRDAGGDADEHRAQRPVDRERRGAPPEAGGRGQERPGSSPRTPMVDWPP